ncbi:ABC transporter permease [Micrococcus lylae]|uniref:ABC transporter permease n=1 Tax=Micrococcus lylae TaxID=1273 RepID=UPI002883488E|nr:ABC transporter permease [Micrococcus lylae]
MAETFPTTAASSGGRPASSSARQDAAGAAQGGAPGTSTASGPLQPPFGPAESARRVRRRGLWYFAEHQLRSMRRYGSVLVVNAVGEPLVYLLAMGLGLATLISGGASAEVLGGATYLQFIAPALLASSALMTASVEFSYPVMDGFKWHRIYYAPQATPISPTQIAAGHLTAVSLRFLAQSAVFYLIMTAFGATDSPWSWLQVFSATLGGLAIGSWIMAFAASIRDEKGQFALLQRFVVMPLFLFSATFYPLTQLPLSLQWIGWISPQWHAAQLGRVLSYGMDNPAWLTAVHVLYLMGLAASGALVAVAIYTRRLGWRSGRPDPDAVVTRTKGPRGSVLSRRAERASSAPAASASSAAEAAGEATTAGEAAGPGGAAVVGTPGTTAGAVPPMPEITVRTGALSGMYSGNIRAVLERAFLSLKSNNWAVFVSGFAEPVLYLLSLGIGLGSLIGELPGPDGQPIPYGMYIAPALLAVSAMNGAVYDSTWNVFFKLRYAKTYQTMLATRLGPLDVALGEILMALFRGAVYAASFLIVMALMGLVTSWTALLMVPGALLVAFGFAAVGMAVTSYMKTFQHMDWIMIVMLPMFLFSATFFPLQVYPTGVQWFIQALPLWHAVEMMRHLAVGVVTWATAGHILYFVVMAAVGLVFASRRLARLFLR